MEFLKIAAEFLATVGVQLIALGREAWTQAALPAEEYDAKVAALNADRRKVVASMRAGELKDWGPDPVKP